MGTKWSHTVSISVLRREIRRGLNWGPNQIAEGSAGERSFKESRAP
jgi:hypothetical protein